MDKSKIDLTAPHLTSSLFRLAVVSHLVEMCHRDRGLFGLESSLQFTCRLGCTGLSTQTSCYFSAFKAESSGST